MLSCTVSACVIDRPWSRTRNTAAG